MKSRLTTFLLLLTCCWLPLTATGQMPGVKFRPKLLMIDANEGIDVADINRDGKLDIVAGRFWFAGPEFTPRPLRTIDDWNGYVQSNGDFCHDVDQDGWMDVIAGSFLPTEVHWYRNPGKEPLELGQLWEKKLLVDTQLSRNEASFLRDLDGDGEPEWISNSWDKKNPMVVWEFVKTTRTFIEKKGRGKNAREVKSEREVPSLTKNIIGPINGHGIGFGDINNDGHEDILFAQGWYERPEKNIYASAWKLHEDWDLHASCPMFVRDVNGDGKNDLIWGKGHDYGLYCWLSKGIAADGKFAYQELVIDDTFSQPHTLQFADIDGDGKDELITGKRVRAHNGRDPGGTDIPCMYYYKWMPDQTKFQRFVIDEGHIGTGLQIRTADLNSDGLLDIAVAGKDGTWVLINGGK